MNNHIFKIFFSAILLTCCNPPLTKTTKSLPKAKASVGHKIQLTSNDPISDSALFILEKERELRQRADVEEYLSSSENYTESPVEQQQKPQDKLFIKEIKNTRIINQSKEYSEGRVVYNIPQKMKVRSSYHIFLRIAKSKATFSIYDSLGGQVSTAVIPVTQTMEVKLIDTAPNDNKAFEIISDNSNEQMIENGDTFTEWSWNVIPIRPGKTSLDIIVSIVRDGNKKEIVYQDNIIIERDIPAQCIFFWQIYWKWIITTLILPFIGWAYKRRKENKEKEKQK